MKQQLKSLASLASLALLPLLHCFGINRPQQQLCANIAEGTHSHSITRRADAAIATRFSLVKPGSDAAHVAVSGVADIPLGFCLDEPAAGDYTAVALLGASDSTQRGIASGAVAVGDFLVPAASGAVRTLPATAGTYYIVGRAVVPAASGEIVEIDPCVPMQRVVS